MLNYSNKKKSLRYVFHVFVIHQTGIGSIKIDAVFCKTQFRLLNVARVNNALIIIILSIRAFCNRVKHCRRSCV